MKTPREIAQDLYDGEPITEAKLEDIATAIEEARSASVIAARREAFRDALTVVVARVEQLRAKAKAENLQEDYERGDIMATGAGLCEADVRRLFDNPGLRPGEDYEPPELFPVP